jgi:hypothetical protein
VRRRSAGRLIGQAVRQYLVSVDVAHQGRGKDGSPVYQLGGEQIEAAYQDALSPMADGSEDIPATITVTTAVSSISPTITPDTIVVTMALASKLAMSVALLGPPLIATSRMRPSVLWVCIHHTTQASGTSASSAVTPTSRRGPAAPPAAAQHAKAQPQVHQSGGRAYGPGQDGVTLILRRNG